MTIYHFERIKAGETIFYPMREEAEKGFRSALATWMKKHREKQFLVMQCRQVKKRLITGEKIFLGLEIIREV